MPKKKYDERTSRFPGKLSTVTRDSPEVNQGSPTVTLMSDQVIAYTDGSYDNTLKKYSFGCVLILPTGEILTESGNGDNPESLAIRNVAGEMIGAMYAVLWALKNGYREIELRYDYEGIEKWVTGAWKTKNALTAKYAESMRRWGTLDAIAPSSSEPRKIRLSFAKVTAHTGDRYNEMADRLAKAALREGHGIPPITKVN